MHHCPIPQHWQIEGMTIEGYKPGLQLGYSVYEARNQIGCDRLLREQDLSERRC